MQNACGHDTKMRGTSVVELNVRQGVIQLYFRCENNTTNFTYEPTKIPSTSAIFSGNVRVTMRIRNNIQTRCEKKDENKFRKFDKLLQKTSLFLLGNSGGKPN